MEIIFNFHCKMRRMNLILLILQLLSILVSVHCYKHYKLRQISKILKNGMLNKATPCNDFYVYTCGAWIKNSEKSVGKEMSSILQSEMTAITVMKDIFENPNIDRSNTKLNVEKHFYDTCMDQAYSRKEGKKLLAKIVRETPQTNWQDVAEYYATFSAIDLFHIKLAASGYLEIEQPYYSESNREPFENMKNEVSIRVKMLYEKFPNSYFVKKLRNIDSVKQSITFIQSVNDLLIFPRTERDREYIKFVNIAQLQKLYNHYCPSDKIKIEWLQFFQKLAKGSRTNFTETDELRVDVKYLKDLCILLNKTPEHAIVIYILYNFVFNEGVAYFTNDISEFNYIDKYIYCIQRLKITEGITSEVINSYISQESKSIVQKMFNSIKFEMIKEIRSSWLVNNGKKKALDMALRMTHKYGIPGDPVEKKLGVKVTYEFDVSSVGLKNDLNFKRAQIINFIETYKTKEGNRGKRSSEANAFYHYKENVLIIGIGYMFPPYFHQNAPIGFNYGRLGFTIGHEISHAFDFDKMFQIIKFTVADDELKDKMKEVLLDKRECFINQSERFKVDGERTLHENVADTQGLKLALRAMNADIKHDGKADERLPNLEHKNQKKLFFLSFANIWCSNPEYREDDGEDDHAPFVVRSLATLQNMNEFAETYNCMSDQIMNPILKCDWWDDPCKSDESCKPPKHNRGHANIF